MADVCIALVLHRLPYRKNEKCFILAKPLKSTGYGMKTIFGTEGDLNPCVVYS
jgi:hypothetical protein